MDTETATKGGNGKTDRETALAALAAVPKPVAAHGAETSPVETDIDIKDRTLWLCRMPYGGSRMLAAAFCSIGLDTRVTPEEDSRTLELGGKYTSGDECYPQRIVLGDYMKLIEDEKLDPKKTAFLLPTANGPCRFGQYVGLLRRMLDDQGYEDVAILSFTSADGYAGIGEQASELIRTAWRAVHGAGHPAEAAAHDPTLRGRTGQTDRVYLESLDLMADIVARQGVGQEGAMADLKAGLLRVKKLFQRHPGQDGGPPAHRRGGRDLLPPQHLRQQRAHPPHRGPGRRVLAVRRGRMGVVHERGGLPAPPRGEKAGRARTG